MSTKIQLESALREAIRSGDELRKRTIRLALASIRNAELEKRAPLDEPAALAVLHREVKARREAIAEAEQAGRPELAAASEAEISVLEQFLPQPFSQEELHTLALHAIAEAGATSHRDMGQVMKILMPRLQGRAEGSQVSQIVRQLLEPS